MGRKVVKYKLDYSMTKERIKTIEDKYGKITCHEKSSLYKLNVPNKFLLKGAMDTDSVTVTYKEDDPRETRSELENLLETLGR